MGFFTDKVAVVTGAASGLGRALALELAGRGARVVGVDIDAEGLEATASAAGGACASKCVNVAVLGEMEKMASEVLSEYGRVDLLVNNAGVGVGGELVEVPVGDLDWIVGINLMGPVYGTKLLLPQMIERGSGHVVNVSSVAGLVLLPFHMPYMTTKFAVTGFSEALWAEARRHGVGVTLVCPAGIRTDIIAHSRLHSSDEGQVRFADKFTRLVDEKGMEPSRAARKVLAAVERDRFLCMIGAQAHLLYYLRRIAPGPWRHAVAALTARVSADGGQKEARG